MTRLIRQSCRLLLLYTIVLGVGYPILVTGFAQWVFPEQANGNLIGSATHRQGSLLIGQTFTNPEYFWGRPSAILPHPYDASDSTGSNIGPLNPKLRKAVEFRITALRIHDPDNQLPIPIDLVTSSGSGLDPHISPQAADYQVPRIARLRGIPIDRVHDLVKTHIECGGSRLLSAPRVNVLRLNLDLDKLDDHHRACYDLIMVKATDNGN